MNDWHRLFGLILADYLSDSPFEVLLEQDLSKQQQLIDVIILRKTSDAWHEPLPDGFGELASYNLLSFKSHKETLTLWTMQELIGHYVSYRKMVSPAPNNLLDESNFRLLIFCVRSPQQLASQLTLQQRGEGYYDCDVLGIPIRIIVGHELPQAAQNVMLHFFSAKEDQVQYAANHFRQRSPQTSTLLRDLARFYLNEDFDMTDLLQKYFQEAKEKFLQELTAEDRARVFQNMSVEERKQTLWHLPTEERQSLFENMSVEERKQMIQHLSVEDREQLLENLPLEERLHGLSPQEILTKLSPEEIEAYLRKIKENGDKTDRQ